MEVGKNRVRNRLFMSFGCGNNELEFVVVSPPPTTTSLLLLLVPLLVLSLFLLLLVVALPVVVEVPLPIMIIDMMRHATMRAKVTTEVVVMDRGCFFKVVVGDDDDDDDSTEWSKAK